MEKLNFKHSETINHICFSSNGKHIFSLTEKSIYLWDLDTKNQIDKLELEEEFQGVHTQIFRTSTENIYCLFISEWDEILYGFYEIVDNKIHQLGKIKTEFRSYYNSFQVVNNQIILADSKSCVVYNLSDFKELYRFSNLMTDANSTDEIDVKINQEGTKIVFLHFSEKYMQLYSIKEGTLIKTIENKKAYFDEADGPSFCFRANTNEIYSYRKFGECVSFNVWDSDSGKLLENERALDYTFGGNARNMQISDDGKYVWMNFSAEDGAEILCWKLKKHNAEALWKLEEIPNNAKIDFSPTSNFLALNLEHEIILLNKDNVDGFCT